MQNHPNAVRLLLGRARVGDVGHRRMGRYGRERELRSLKLRKNNRGILTFPLCVPTYNLKMADTAWSIRELRTALANGTESPGKLTDRAMALANRNRSRNTYLWQSASWTRAEAARVELVPRGKGGVFGDGRGPLWGLPVSVKDCFDLAGSPTSSGTKFYREKLGIATRDSWLVERLRAEGAVNNPTAMGVA